MITVFKLELLCDDFFDKKNVLHSNSNWWLNYIRRLGPDKSPSCVSTYPDNKSVKCLRDYTHANQTGSKGIFAYYMLQDGIYQVAERYKINRVRHYLIIAENGKYREITKREADQWRKNILA